LFNDNWCFMLADISEAKNPGFDSRDWSRLTLPHDWSIREKFDRNAPAGNDGGYLPTGIGWYRKTFDISTSTSGRKMQLYFEGVYMNEHNKIFKIDEYLHMIRISQLIPRSINTFWTIPNRRIADGIAVRVFTVMFG